MIHISFFKRMLITQLPHSIILKIFQYLDHSNLCLGARSTCKTWYYLTYDFSLWKVLDLSEFCNKINDSVFLHILSPLQKQVEEINLNHCEWLTDIGFVHSHMFCPNLKRLYIQGTNINNVALEILVNKYPDLERLSVFMCPRLSNVYKSLCKLKKLVEFIEPYDEVRLEDLDNGLIQISESCLHMREICIEFQETLYNETLVKIIKNCRSVEKLQIPNCKNITDHCFIKTAIFCKNFINLNISETKIGDPGLKVIAESCLFLEVLRVAACPVTDIGFYYIAKHCKNLKFLVVNETATVKGKITDMGLKAISEGCPCLEEIIICYCPFITDYGIITLAENCKNFQVLYIAGCVNLTDTSVLTLAKHCSRMTRLVATKCLKLTSLSINQLVLNCPHLEMLELEKCELLKDFYFDNISNKRNEIQFGTQTYFYNNLDGHQTHIAILNIPVFDSVPYFHLEILDLGLCTKVDDISIMQIAKYCRALDYLSLHGCHLVGDLGITMIAEKCHLLRHLNISASFNHLSKITDQGLIAISKFCEQLQYLNVRSNFEITEKGVQSVIQKCPSLRKLCLTFGNRTYLNENIVTTIVKEYRNSYQVQLYGKKCSYEDNCQTHLDLNFEFPPLRRLRAPIQLT